MENIRNGPEYFEFSKEWLCALRSAFAHNPDAIEQLRRAEIDDELLQEAISAIKKKGAHTVIPRNEKIELVYREIAGAEFARLKAEAERIYDEIVNVKTARSQDTAANAKEVEAKKLACGHAIHEHKFFLRLIMDEASGGRLTTEN
ncbi:MAG: hypothetical protein AAB897_00175 [Patescibacteria group bacterium]